MTAMTDENDFHIIDLCGTLVKDDTTLGLLEWHFRLTNRLIPRLLVHGVRIRMSPIRWFFTLIERISGRHIAKGYLVGLLRGTPKSSVEESAKIYAEWLTRERLNPAVISLLTSKQQETGGWSKQVIASASLEPIVAAVANELGLSYVASQLEEEEGVLTGRYACDISGRKEEALAKKFGEEMLTQMSLAISDNFSDLALLLRAVQAYAVVYNDRQRSRWLSEKLHILDLRAVI